MAAADQAASALRAEFGVPAEARVLLTLSRISPEKGQDRLLHALRDWERSDAYPAQPLCLFICGGAAYMQGRRHLEKLRALARKLTRTRVVFPATSPDCAKPGSSAWPMSTSSRPGMKATA
jgi:glycosyltransferase involved in cell wall biosynthesis